MGKIKIILDKDETLEEVESDLFKALNLHASGQIHDNESFKDLAMNDVARVMKDVHDRIYQDMLAEIFLALEEEYRS